MWGHPPWGAVECSALPLAETSLSPGTAGSTTAPAPPALSQRYLTRYPSLIVEWMSSHCKYWPQMTQYLKESLKIFRSQAWPPVQPCLGYPVPGMQRVGNPAAKAPPSSAVSAVNSAFVTYSLCGKGFTTSRCAVLHNRAALTCRTPVVPPCDKVLLSRRKGPGDSFVFLYSLLIPSDELK